MTIEELQTAVNWWDSRRPSAWKWNTKPLAEAARLVANGREVEWCDIHDEPSWLIDCVSNTDLCKTRRLLLIAPPGGHR